MSWLRICHWINEKEGSVPIKNGQGYSKFTPDKEFGLEAILQQHMSVCNNIIGRDYVLPSYYFIDCHAGCGYNEKIVGSPLVLYQNRYHIRHNIYAAFLDINQDNITALKTACSWNPIRNSGSKIITDTFKIACCDNRTIVPKLAEAIKFKESQTKKLAYGMFYLDPNGVPDLSIIKSIGSCCKHIDLLIRINGTALKRTAIAFNKDVRLEDVIRACNKSKIIIRAPVQNDPNGWTFILASNYINYKAWKSKRFFDLTSKEGTEIFRKINYTIAELKSFPVEVEDKQPEISIETFNLFEEDL